MFRTIKSKILSGLIVLGALIQPASARTVNYEPLHSQGFSNTSEKSESTALSTEQKQKPLSDYGWPIGTGLMTLGALFVMKKLDEPINMDELRKYVPDMPAKKASVPTAESIRNNMVEETKTDLFKVSDQKLLSFTAPFDPLAIRPIVHENKMSDAERDLLANRLHAIRKMEDINRERAVLTRQMAKAKKNNDIQTIQAITLRRKELAAIRKESFATAAGPLWSAIKEERRLLTKKMTQARRRQDLSARAEITQRRSMMKTQEELLKLTVRDFKYKVARPTFIRKKSLSVNQMVQLSAEKYRMAG
ncbi:MAG: hypothetical protein IJV07_01490 [Alphaproteobacteria bacterium]|nr:hypothetical protein [Alphaproteobacteria bacterium]